MTGRTLGPVRRHFRERTRVAALALGVALGVALGRPAPPERTLEGLAAALGAAASASVLTTDIAWEPSRGAILDALYGRRVLFLGSKGPGKERDLFRAKVRVSPEGQPVEAIGLRNLTETPLGDEAGLEVRGRAAVFATTAFGRVQGVSFLDLDGPKADDRPSGLAGKVVLRATSYRRSGSFTGLGRTDVVFDRPAAFARFALTSPRVRLELDDPVQAVVVDLGAGAVRTESGADAPGFRVVQRDYSDRSPLTWSVDLVRSYVGAGPIARLEDATFTVRDVARRAFDGLFGGSPKLKPVERAPPPRVLTPQALAEEGWPPDDVPSLWESPRAGEGKWQAVTDAFLPRTGEAPPYFHTTIIRPDPDRSYAEVRLIAMDMRQLELGMEGGYEEPLPQTGPPGTGRIPRDPSVSSRVVAAFNGAFKAEHGQYGMMVQRRLLVPPQPGAATVLVRANGDAGFGSWPADFRVPEDVVSFRQNLDPLVSDGVVNPTGRNVWGFQIAADSTHTERTALCLTRSRHAYFAWGKELSGPGLARALKQAGCDYAVHLDMNPRHCAFVFMQAPGAGGKGGQYRLADPGMSVNPSRYVDGSDKDFFYVMRRDFALASSGGQKWEVSPGVQPPPSWLSGIHESQREMGDAFVRVIEFDPGRVEWIVRAGTGEPSTPGARSKKIGLEPSLDGRVVAAFGVGHTTESLRYGLAFDGTPVLDLRRSYATVVLEKEHAPVVVPPGDAPPLAAGQEAVQLPLLADRGQVETRAMDRGGMRDRGAMCVAKDGKVLVALGRHDSADPVTNVLLELGCDRVVGLDRGSRHGAFAHRAGTEQPPLGSYEPSVLYAVSRGMIPRAARF
jgi:hypothetical protein